MHIRSTLSVLVGWLGPFVTAVMMVHFYEGVFFFFFFLFMDTIPLEASFKISQR